MAKSHVYMRLLMHHKLSINQPQNQQGVALIIAILVVAVVAAIATAIMSDSYVNTQRAYRHVHGEQAMGYLRATETFAYKALMQDLVYDDRIAKKRVDSCEDIWNPIGGEIRLGLENGEYGGYINDLSGFFNLNSVVQATNNANNQNQTPLQIPSNIHQARFMSLLRTFNDVLPTEITEQQARLITGALVDWIDQDNTVSRPFGAERGFYEGLTPPARPSNQPMADISELLLVLQVLEDKNLAALLYEQLVQHVTVWPRTGGLINVNTATSNVLRTLNATLKSSPPPLTENEISSRGGTGTNYKTIEEFETAFTQKMDSDTIAISSDYFELISQVKLGDYESKMYTVIERFNDNVDNNTRTIVNFLARNSNGVDRRNCQ